MNDGVIYINNKKFKVFQGDIEETIEIKYAIQEETLLNYLYIYDRNNPEEFWELKPELRLIADDLKEIVRTIKYEDLYLFYKERMEHWPEVTETDFGCLWISANTSHTKTYQKPNYSLEEIKMNLEPLRKLNSTDFANVYVTESNLDRWKDDYKSSLDALKEKYNYIENVVFSRISEIVNSEKTPGLRPGVSRIPEVEPFVKETIQYKVTVKIPFAITLTNIFDSIKLSENLPFIALKKDNKFYYKIYKKDFLPETDWIEKFEDSKGQGILIKIFKSKIRKNVYNDIWWLEDNTIRYGSNETLTKEKIEKILFGSITSFPVEKVDETMISISGKIIIRNTTFIDLLFLDMVTNDPLLNFYFMYKDTKVVELFPSKAQESKGKSGKRFQLYFWPKIMEEFENSFSLTLANSIDGETPVVKLHIFRITSEERIERFRTLAGILFAYYTMNKEEVIENYSKFVGDFTKALDERSSKMKEQKARMMIKLLRKKLEAKIGMKKEEIQLFINKDYSRTCVAQKQPRVMDKEEYDEFIDSGGDPERVIQFPYKSGIYYICDQNPFQGGENYQYAGLVRNKTRVPEANQKYPYVPCCFSTNQYTRKGIFKAYEETKGHPGEISSLVATASILGPGKLPKVHQSAVLPFNILRLFSFFYEENIETRIVRTAVIRDDNNSFIHACLMAEKYNFYSNLPNDEKIKLAAEYRENLARSNNFLESSQELYGLTKEDMIDLIKNKNKQFSPKLFHRFMEIKLNTNIILFKYDDKINKDGGILIPNSAHAWLSSLTDYKKGMIVIIVHRKGCEIVGDRKHSSATGDKKSVSPYFFSDPEITRGITDLYTELYSVNTIYKSGELKPYNGKDLINHILIKEATGQYIDNDGKVRALFYDDFDNLYISIEPLAPLELTDKYSTLRVPRYINSWSTVVTFLNFYKDHIIITGKNEAGIILDIIWKENISEGINETIKGFIKTIPPRTLDIEIFPSAATSSLLSGNNDDFRLFQYHKKIATYLKEYLLFIYSNHPTSDPSSLIVIKKSNYKPGLTGGLSLNNHYFVEGRKRLIVPSEEAKIKLLYYLKVMLYNAHYDVMLYKERNKIWEDYNSISDFTLRKNEIIFLSSENLLNWLKNRSEHSFNKVRIQADSDAKIPYLYKDYRLMNGKIIMIQNVHKGNRERALNVSAIWMIKGYNNGYYSDKISEVRKVSYQEFHVQTGEITTIRKETESQALIINYGEDSYGAILAF